MFALCEEILKTLPIGYYLGHGNIQVELSQEDKTFVDLNAQKIAISYPMILQSLSKMNNPTREERESAIRCLLYHEISHIILTPNLICYDMKEKEILNIFEDERIETVMANYYYGVDFKTSIKRICNYDPAKTDEYLAEQDPVQKFFLAVRFGVGEPEALSAVEKILKKFCFIRSSSDYMAVTIYRKFVLWLYYTYFEKNESEVPQGIVRKTEEEVSQILNEVADTKSDTSRTAISDIFEEKINQDKCGFYASIEKLLSSAVKKQRQRSASSSAYAGVLNPRSIALSKNYKWFDKKADKGVGKRFDKIHFNLFVDSSSSFVKSESTLNELLRSLQRLEKDYTDFTFTLVKLGKKSRIDNVERFVRCNETSWLRFKEIDPIYNKANAIHDATVYNMVVMDGEFIVEGNAFKVFNHPNVYIVSDTGNESEIKTWASKAKTTIIRKNYAERFAETVLSVLERALS